MNLYINNTPEANALVEQLNFQHGHDGTYLLDSAVIDHLDVAQDAEEGHRPVAVHILPYTRINDEVYYYAFNTAGRPAIYVSFPLTSDDFVTSANQNDYFSLCRTVIGKIVTVFDQPHLDLKLDMRTFMFPSVVNGEFVWSVEVKGDDNVSVDALVAQMGTVIGRIAHRELIEDCEGFNALSAAIIGYKDTVHVPT